MKDSFSEINVVPLVDIMLVLIVIVLITANFMVQGSIEVNLPKAESRESSASDGIHLAINADGAITFDKKELALEELPTLLHGLDRGQAVLISADKDLRLQSFIDLLDSIKRLGFEQISVQTTR